MNVDPWQDSNEASDNPRLLFFKLPPSLPIVRRSASAKGKEKVFTSAVPDQRSSVAPVMVGRGPSLMASGSQRNVSLKELSGGQMGKLLVYKSGAIKLKLGDTLYDVSSFCNICLLLTENTPKLSLSWYLISLAGCICSFCFACELMYTFIPYPVVVKGYLESYHHLEQVFHLIRGELNNQLQLVGD